MDIFLALNTDEDVRVRFRTAVLTGGLFSLSEGGIVREYQDLDRFYQNINDSLPNNLAQYVDQRSQCCDTKGIQI